MSLATWIYKTLSEATEVAAIAQERIYPNAAPASALKPYVVYQTISNTPNDTKSGVSKVDDVRIQITTHASTYLEAEALSEQIRQVLDRRASTEEGTEVQSVQYLDTNDLFSEQAEYYGIASDYKIRLIR